jgi:hypothetical protein
VTRYRFELAEPADDAALRRLMAQTPMDGRVMLSFQREPGYFDANCVLGRNRQTIVCRDVEQNEIVGLATRSIREMYIAGRATRVGYLSGLRIAERARRQDVLARGYRFLRELHEADPHAPDYYLTTIAEDNTVAIDQLTSRRAGLPAYHPLTRLHTLVLPIHRRPSRSKPESRATCRISTADDIQEVIEFLNASGAQKTFFPKYQQADFEPPDATFRGLQTSSICVATRNGQIIGTAGVWNQQAFRQTVVSGYQPAVRLLRPLLNLWSRVTGGIQLPAIGSSLGAAFVCLPVVSDNEPAVFTALLQQLMRIAPADVPCLLLGLCDNDPWLPLAQSLSRSRYTTRLYAVNWSAAPASVVSPSAKPYYLELGCL